GEQNSASTRARADSIPLRQSCGRWNQRSLRLSVQSELGRIGSVNSSATKSSDCSLQTPLVFRCPIRRSLHGGSRRLRSAGEQGLGKRGFAPVLESQSQGNSRLIEVGSTRSACCGAKIQMKRR